MGSTHAASGALAGVAVAAVAGGALVDLAACGLVGAGAALLPDLDHPESTATRSQGPASQGLSRAVRAASSAVWRATRAPGDDGGLHDGLGRHRHLTHTLPACAAAGVVCGAAASTVPGAAVVLWVLVSLGLRGLGQCVRGQRRAALSSWLTVSLAALLVTGVVLGVAPPHPVLLGAVVAAGALVHVLGDWATSAGVPLAWPLMVRGKRWWMFRSPLAFRAGDGAWQERVLRWACGLGAPALCVWAMMG
ncbi:metal-dependent hydrolase [Streptomonospora nanhaiensis]|uniref:metal-dependent hydrolase n=1 Tax=Streptomonospora nanhaiensis TaxID=1323731 RepID=UPI001C386377|nr:metal-dependent hydrolase [Streptomonospora nanhaiensis]MBV2364238.1 metal-dependent hydrolase [Streptomonospora nanhaiensis]